MHAGQCKIELVAVLTAYAASFSLDSAAQNYPSKPVRITVGFPVGVANDTGARLLAQKLTEFTGQNVIVENRPGAAGQLATERFVQLPPDGYNLMMMTSAETIRPAMRGKLPYDAKRDLAAVSLLGVAPYVLLVHPSVPARSVKEFIALAAARPGSVTYGSTGVGSTSHLAGEIFNSMAKIKTVMVSYKGSTDSAIATASGQIDSSFSSITAVLPLLESGRLRPLAVTGTKRSPLMPATPTVSESALPGYECVTWFGVVAPAGTPKEILERLSSLIAKAAPDMAAQMSKQGLDVQTSTPDQFAAMIRREIDQNIKLIRAAGIKPE
jgi:tripartite-type tricarboxylate transporter receptor subunit TctC